MVGYASPADGCVMVAQFVYDVIALAALIGWAAAMASHFRIGELERRLSSLADEDK